MSVSGRNFERAQQMERRGKVVVGWYHKRNIGDKINKKDKKTLSAGKNRNECGESANGPWVLRGERR